MTIRFSTGKDQQFEQPGAAGTVLTSQGPTLTPAYKPIGDPVGAAGTVLTSNGVGVKPTYQAVAAPAATAAGFSMLAFLDLFPQDGITAFSGGGQGSATPITGQVARVDTVAAANDSVLLPASEDGLVLILINSGANAMDVFPHGTETIDGESASAAVSQLPGTVVIYTCVTAGHWTSMGLTTLIPVVSAEDGITAFSGGGQGSATPLTKAINRVSTAAAPGDSVLLPAALAGEQITVINGDASNSISVFPASGEQINALGANNAYGSDASTISRFICVTAGQWWATTEAMV